MSNQLIKPFDVMTNAIDGLRTDFTNQDHNGIQLSHALLCKSMMDPKIIWSESN